MSSDFELEALGYFGDIAPEGEEWAVSDGPWFPVTERLDRCVLYRMDRAMALAAIRSDRARHECRP